MAKKVKKDKPVNKTPELAKAKEALETYLKENNLGPQEDWTKDKKHGKKVTELVNKLNKERDKVAAKYPEQDLKNETKLVKLKKGYKDKETEKKSSKAKKSESGEKKKGSVQKYDYPLIDGKEMTSNEKKKYRMEQRKLAAGDTPKEKKVKTEKADTKKVDKKTSKVAEEVKPKKKDKKAKDKKKKALREED